MFGNKKRTQIIKIEGMNCSHCAKKIEDTLKKEKAIKEVKVDLEQKQATIFLKEEVKNEYLKEKIEELGYVVLEIKE